MGLDSTARSKAAEEAAAQAAKDVVDARRQALKGLAADIDAVSDLASLKLTLKRILRLFAEEAGIK